MFRELPDGTIGERQYVVYLGKRKWEEMRSQFNSAQLREVLIEWLNRKKSEKEGTKTSASQ